MVANAASPPVRIPKGSVSWGLVQFTFELCSSDSTILEKAATIFRPWVSTNDASPSCRWHIELATGELSSEGQEWEIRSDDKSEVLYRGSGEGVLAMVEHFALLVLRDHAEGLPDLHGALVSKDGRGVMILGAGESGKSTLACALWQRGWSLLCDDLTLVEASQCMAYPVPRRVSLRHTSRPLFAEALVTRILSTPSCNSASESSVFHPDEVDSRERPTSTRIEAMFFLGRNGAARGPDLLQRIQPAQALLALLPYSSRTRGLNLGAALQLFKPLAEGVPAYDLVRGALPEMVSCIEETVRPNG